MSLRWWWPTLHFLFDNLYQSSFISSLFPNVAEHFGWRALELLECSTFIREMIRLFTLIIINSSLSSLCVIWSLIIMCTRVMFLETTWLKLSSFLFSRSVSRSWYDTFGLRSRWPCPRLDCACFWTLLTLESESCGWWSVWELTSPLQLVRWLEWLLSGKMSRVVFWEW